MYSFREPIGAASRRYTLRTFPLQLHIVSDRMDMILLAKSKYRLRKWQVICIELMNSSLIEAELTY